jgi:hypothetical protein
MKKVTFVVSIILICALQGQSQKQFYKNKQLTLIAFNLSIENDVKPYFDSQSHLFPEVENKKADKKISLLKEKIWYLIESRLVGQTEMYIFPINSHGSSFKYDVYGFPDVSINKALKDGSSKYYFKVDLTIGSNLKYDEKGYGSKPPVKKNDTEDLDPKTSILPVISIEITTYNDKGILPVHKFTGSASASNPWVLSEDVFNGVINRKEYNKEDSNYLLGLVNLALTSLLKKF